MADGVTRAATTPTAAWPRDIYQAIADFLYDFDIQASDAPGCALRSLAFAHSKRKVLVPELVTRVFADDAGFAGVAAGNLDNSGVDEVVWVRNSDGAVGVGRVVESDGAASWTGVTKYTGYPATSQWAGVAAGNFDGVPGDEIALVRNSDARILVMKLVNGSLREIASYSLFGAASQWAGIAAGNFDGVLSEIASNTEAGRASNWLGMGAGDFDGDGIDEIVATRDFDGNAYTYKMAGGILKSGTADYFYNGLQHGNLAGGRVRAGMQSRADLVMIQNIDSDLFIFDVLPGSLTY